MKDRAELLAQVGEMLERADVQELDLVWRILHGMLDGKTQTERSTTQ